MMIMGYFAYTTEEGSLEDGLDNKTYHLESSNIKTRFYPFNLVSNSGGGFPPHGNNDGKITPNFGSKITKIDFSNDTYLPIPPLASEYFTHPNADEFKMMNFSGNSLEELSSYYVETSEQMYRGVLDKLNRIPDLLLPRHAPVIQLVGPRDVTIANNPDDASKIVVTSPLSKDEMVELYKKIISPHMEFFEKYGYRDNKVVTQ